MAFQQLSSDTTAEGVLILTMNDPATRNAVGEPMMWELLAELDRFEQDANLRTLVLTGAGTAFSSGANMRGFARDIEQSDARRVEADPPRRSRGPRGDLDPASDDPASPDLEVVDPVIIRRLHALEKPSFAAVNGPAYGLGCGIALACDFRVAAESARFVEAFVLRGVAPADGDAWRLPRLVGMSNALWMLYSGEAVSGAAAYRIGLANWLVDDDQLLPTTLELATTLARGPGYALGMIKELVLRGYEQDFSEHLALAARAFALTRSSPEHREGVQAFLEKRQPNFRGPE